MLIPSDIAQEGSYLKKSKKFHHLQKKLQL